MKNGYYTKSRKAGTYNGYTWYSVVCALPNGATFTHETTGKTREDASTRAVKEMSIRLGFSVTVVSLETLF